MGRGQVLRLDVIGGESGPKIDPIGTVLNAVEGWDLPSVQGHVEELVPFHLLPFVTRGSPCSHIGSIHGLRAPGWSHCKCFRVSCRPANTILSFKTIKVL